MSNKQRKADKSEFQFELADGGRIARRTTELLPDGVYVFADELAFAGVLSTKVLTCAAWLLELYDLHAGELYFISGDAHVRPRTNRFGVFYPPFTISQPCFNNTKGHLIGIAALKSLPAELLISPRVFDTTCSTSPTSTAQVIEILRAGTHPQAIDMNPHPSPLARKTKKLIDENYLVYPAIARIAARLGVTHAHLTRQFKLAFGMSPSAYLRQLRVADVPLRLAQGEAIINVSHAVGYNDLSRFYQQFSQTTKTSPGVCRTMMKPKRG